MVNSPNGLKPATLGEAVDGRFRVGVPLVGLMGGRFGDVCSPAADAVAFATAVVGVVGGSVGRRRRLLSDGVCWSLQREGGGGAFIPSCVFEV